MTCFFCGWHGQETHGLGLERQTSPCEGTRYQDHPVRPRDYPAHEIFVKGISTQNPQTRWSGYMSWGLGVGCCGIGLQCLVFLTLSCWSHISSQLNKSPERQSKSPLNELQCLTTHEWPKRLGGSSHMRTKLRTIQMFNGWWLVLRNQIHPAPIISLDNQLPILHEVFSLCWLNSWIWSIKRVLML